MTRLSLVYEMAARFYNRADQGTVLHPLMGLDDVPTRVTTPYGFHLCGPPHNAAMVAMMRLADTYPYEPLISLFALHMTRGGGSFIDVGSNIGYFSLLVARGTSEPMQVHALEPLPSNFRWLRENVNANGLSGTIMAYDVAAGAAEDELMLSNYGTGASLVRGWDGGAGDEYGTTPVPVRRLDDLFFAERLPGPITIKMDVEGYESEVVAGASRLLSSPAVHCVLLELNHGLHPGGVNETVRDTLDVMAGHGFRCFGHHAPQDGKIQVQDTDLYTPDYHGIQTPETWPVNWICVRPGVAWESFVRQMPVIYGIFCSTSHRTDAELRDFLVKL